MFEAYAIGISLKLNNLISPQLQLLAKEFEKLDLLTTTLKNSLAKISVDSTGLKSLTRAASSTNLAFEKATVSAAAFHRQIQSLTAAAASGAIPRLAPGVGGAGGARVPGGGGGGARGPGGGFHGGNIHMGPGGIGLGTMGMAAGDWFVPLAVSAAALGVSKSLFESAKQLDTEQQRFRLLGMTGAQNTEAFAFARNMRVYGTTQAENLAAFREAQGVGRESGLPGSKALQFAEMAAPVLAKLDALGIGLDEESKSALRESNLGLLRYAEQTGGLQSATQLNAIADRAYKLRQSSGGTIDFQQLRGAAAQGGRYLQNESDLGWAMSEPILQVVGGQKYGTGVATAGSRLFNVMSKTPKNLIELATKLKLWTGGRQHLDDADSALFNENFVKFYIERLMPLYKANNFTAADITRADAILLGRTGARIGGDIQQALPAIQNAAGAFNVAKTIDQAGLQLPKSISGQEAEFAAAWTDFKTQWGVSILPFFTGILKAGAALLRPADENTPWYVSAGKGLLNPFGSVASMIADGATEAFGPSTKSPYQRGRGASGSWTDSTVNIHVDGQKLATAVVPHMGKALSGPQTGTNDFDSRLMPTPAGGTGSW